jgi:hypothetical protein
MPRASVSTATSVKPGCLTNCRAANRKSFIHVFVIHHLSLVNRHFARQVLQRRERATMCLLS